MGILVQPDVTPRPQRERRVPHSPETAVPNHPLPPHLRLRRPEPQLESQPAGLPAAGEREVAVDQARPADDPPGFDLDRSEGRTVRLKRDCDRGGRWVSAEDFEGLVPCTVARLCRFRYFRVVYLYCHVRWFSARK